MNSKTQLDDSFATEAVSLDQFVLGSFSHLIVDLDINTEFQIRELQKKLRSIQRN